MNTQEYILSGIIESYVLGLATAEESTEFEKMCVSHSEVLAARNSFELQLESQVRQNAPAVPAELKEKILAGIENIGSAPVAARMASVPDKEAAVYKINWLKYAAAACFILLAGSLIWAVSLYNKNNRLQADNTLLQDSLRTSTTRLAQIEADAEVLQQNPNIKMAALQGTPHSPKSLATVYWDTTSKDVYLLINNLPAPATDKQYQLWALLDGKPINMGMIEMENMAFRKEGLLLQMKNAQNAQAFAITLEKRGGSETPTMDEMYVMGKL